MLPVAILAGGLATRLRPLTDRVPKSLLPIAGRPFIFHQLELLREQGVRRVVLCVGHLGDRIQEAVGNGRSLGLSIEYSFDGGAPQGTGGALRRALALLEPEFFVLYGDSYTPCSLTRIESAFTAAGLPALMTVLRNQNRWDRSNVALRDGKLIEYRKEPAARADLAYIDFGLSLVSRDVFLPYREGEAIDLSAIWRDLSLRGQLAAFEVSERFYEIGSPHGLRETDAHLSRLGASRPWSTA
jgi:MurNAc alpha-1-phosphate uridylyltransferase